MLLPPTEIRILLIHEPGESHLDSIRNRAEKMHAMGYISTVPTVRAEPSSLGGLWVAILEGVAQDDRRVWIGFCEGTDFCRNNRYVAVGAD